MDAVIYLERHRNSFISFGAVGCEIWPLPLTTNWIAIEHTRNTYTCSSLKMLLVAKITMQFYARYCTLQVKFLDLTLPQYWLPRYDWVLSTEVLEHIPAEFENIALDNIDRAAGHGIVLSWATIGQPGFYHVNNRSPAYVEQIMLDRGFTADVKCSLSLRKKAKIKHLKKNLMVFVRR